MDREPDLKFWEITAFGALVLGIVAVGLFAYANHSLKAAAVLCLLGLAAQAAGGIIGFIFGVPKFRTDAVHSGTFLHNSNLEQISDWLTKIIVGATLVQLGEIADAIGRVSVSISQELSKDGVVGAATAASSVMVFSFFAAFMWGYLWMSLKVKKELNDAISDGRATPAAVDPVVKTAL